MVIGMIGGGKGVLDGELVGHIAQEVEGREETKVMIGWNGIRWGTPPLTQPRFNQIQKALVLLFPLDATTLISNPLPWYSLRVKGSSSSITHSPAQLCFS